ncbi:BQ5605_C032g11067 [Microbotryum silenes-dioicae]|nr:BQ5605_C032g11067 [Microbotryum silenes-dioicae]
MRKLDGIISTWERELAAKGAVLGTATFTLHQHRSLRHLNGTSSLDGAYTIWTCSMYNQVLKLYDKAGQGAIQDTLPSKTG